MLLLVWYDSQWGFRKCKKKKGQVQIRIRCEVVWVRRKAYTSQIICMCHLRHTFIFLHFSPNPAYTRSRLEREGDSVEFTSAIRWTWPVGPVSQLNEREITSSATAPLSAPLLQLLRLEVKTSLKHQFYFFKKIFKLSQSGPINFSRMRVVSTVLIRLWDWSEQLQWCGLVWMCKLHVPWPSQQNYAI